VCEKKTNQFQYGNLHHALVEISGLILNDLDRHYLMCLHVLAFDNLPEGPLAKNVENQISKTVRLFRVMSRLSRTLTDLCPSSVPNQSLT
jgi:hypothetical protein